MKKLTSFLTLFTLLAIPSCGQKTFDEKMASLYKGTVPLIKTAEMNQKSNIVILDIRSPQEYNISHIQGAQLIDFDSFKKKDVANIDKDAEVIVYCSVGVRSEIIGEKMQKMGFTNVKNLYGGIFDWKNQDQQVVNKREHPTDSIHTYNKAWSKWLYKGIKIYD